MLKILRYPNSTVNNWQKYNSDGVSFNFQQTGISEKNQQTLLDFFAFLSIAYPQ